MSEAAALQGAMDYGLVAFIDAGSNTRLHALGELPPACMGTLELEAFCSLEALSSLYRHELLVLSSNAHIDLDALLGQQLSFSTRLADGSAYPRSGYVIEARRLGADGALTRYQLSLAPWMWQLTQRTDCRVFQEKSALEIVEAVLSTHAPHADWHLAEGVESFIAEAPRRSYCVQYRETDYDFVTRLFAEEGLGFCFVPVDQPQGNEAPRHALLIFAHNDALPEDVCSAQPLGGSGIRFHRAGAQESQDAVTALGAQRVLQASISSALSWDYKQKRAVIEQVEGEAGHASEHLPPLIEHDAPGAYAFASGTMAARALRLAREAREARNKRFVGQGSVRSFAVGHRFLLRNSPLDDAARGRGESPAKVDLLLTHLTQVGVNNLPRPQTETLRVLGEVLGEMLTAIPANADDAAGLLAQAAQRGYANRFEAQRVHIPWRPALQDETGMLLNPRPTAPGVQTATVVGPQGECVPGASGEIHTDALHRVRVQFHWQQIDPMLSAVAPHTTWLRLASRHAGPGLGAQFVPRIGQCVLVGFLEGDIDRPIVLGSLFDGAGENGTQATPGGADAASRSLAPDSRSFMNAKDHSPAHQGNRIAGGHSPAWHGEAAAYGPMRNAAALSGFRSAEFNRPHAGYNQLVFDDTDGQQRIQLASTQAATQLNLGHLIHQADNYRGSHRGDGFELRTDAWGAVRAGRGLLLSTWPIQAAIDQPSSEPMGDATTPVALLRQATELARNASRIAATHQTIRLAANEGNQGANQSTLKCDQAPLPALQQSAKALMDAHTGAVQPSAQSALPHSEASLLTLAGRGGLACVAGQAQQWHCGETLTWASGQDSNYALASHLRIHTGQALGLLSSATGNEHLQLIASQGPVTAQAQADALTLAARQQLKMVSVTGKLDAAAAKKIHLAVAGGAAITIEGGNITVQCPGTLTVHAASKRFAGPGKLDLPLPQMPNSVCKSCLLAARASGSAFAVK
ncbi:MAG: type IV secretion protein Rhs [Candidatus Dactylopiibacterium carminicum]|nr:MAG: type IV secretion protein Rhs [Candidatus Dactylopiibacterium carminicum]